MAGHDLQLEYERYRNELVDAMTVIETDLDRRRRKLGSGRPPTGAGGRDVPGGAQPEAEAADRPKASIDRVKEQIGEAKFRLQQMVALLNAVFFDDHR